MDERKRGFQKGRVPENRGDGEAYRWLMTHRDYQGNDCLIWPFSKDKNGRGRFGFTDAEGNKTMKHAPYFMCEMAHGEKPSSKHLAVVICNGRKLGCCNPRHINWRTKSKLMLEYFQKNPLKDRTGSKAKYPLNKIQKIKPLLNVGVSKSEIARQLVMPYSTVEYWITRRERLGFDQGPTTRRRALGIQPVRLLKSQRTIFGAEDTYRIVNSLVPQGALAREDAVQEIMLAFLEGRASLDEIKCGGWRTLTRITFDTNFESSGYALSLDLPMPDGRSWHDVLSHEQGLGNRW